MRRTLVLAFAFLASVALHAQDPQEGTWGGTLSRTNPTNQRPQRQKFALEFKKAPDPHWAWRPGGGETWNVTVISQQGRAQAQDLRLEGDKLSFAFRRFDFMMTCDLTRQAEGTYEGPCVAEADGARFAASLTPPKPSAK